MRIETDRLIITEFTVEMAPAVSENSLDEDTKRFVPDEIWSTAAEARETLEYLIEEKQENVGYNRAAGRNYGNLRDLLSGQQGVPGFFCFVCGAKLILE